MVGIEGGTKSNKVKVTSDGLMCTDSIAKSIQFHESFNHERGYQVIGEQVALTAGTHTILHIKNTSQTNKMIITYIRIQAVALTTSLPVESDYFEIGVGTTYSSGGTAVTPVNINRTSGNTASGEFYDDSPTVTGTFVPIDKWYVEANGKEHVYNKEGALVLGPNSTLEIRFVTASTDGTAKARISFFERGDD